MVIITDASGGRTLRVSLKRSQVCLYFLLLVTVTLGPAALLIDTILTIPTMNETRALIRRNQLQDTQLRKIEQDMAMHRQKLLHAQTAMEVLWNKSGFDYPSNASSIGPVGFESQETSVQSESPNEPHFLEAESTTTFKTVNARHHSVTRLSWQLYEDLISLGHYLRDTDRLLHHTPSICPVQPTWVTSRFGKRHHPILKSLVMHKGIDFGGYTGMEVFSPADGIVIYAGYRGAYGLTVVLDHGYGIQTHFAHLSKVEVKVGHAIKRREYLGQVGNTGQSTGPHLHYEVRKNGRPLDPLDFILD